MLGVAAFHAVLFALSGLGHIPPPVVIQTPINVQLVERTPPPPPPPPPEPPAPEAGGGAPAAPSVVRLSPRPVPQPELSAPPRPAPAPALIVGASDQPGPVPGRGQGGEGSGTGVGQGEGEGPGAGSRERILRGASNAEILPFVSQEARRQRRSGRSSVSCLIRADTRLEDCRIVDESPSGFGFGASAVQIAQTHFRFSPRLTASGRPVAGVRVTVGVNFGRP